MADQPESTAQQIVDDVANGLGEVGKIGSEALNAPVIGPLLGSIPIIGEAKSWLQIFLNIAAAAPTIAKDVEGGAPMVVKLASAAMDVLAAKSETPAQQALIAAAQDCFVRGIRIDSNEARALHPELAVGRETVFG